MAHILILCFFAVVLAVGAYCLWVSLRLELVRVPRLMPKSAPTYRRTYANAGSSDWAGRRHR